MKNSEYRKSKLLHEIRQAKKREKNSIHVRILYLQDVEFIEAHGFVICPTIKHWYLVIL